MKICILSMQKVSNFGSVLQSYSLKKLLESLGHEVSFIDIESRAEDNELLDGKVEFYNEGDVKKGIRNKLKKIDKYAFIRLLNKNKNRTQEELFTSFQNNFLMVDPTDNQQTFDYCVIGSDEVFNCLTKSSWGFTSQLFGNVHQADKVITYAASCGATAFENVPEKVQAKIRESMARLQAISVRDENTYDFTKRFTKTKIEYNLDPVLVGDFTQEMSEARIPFKLPERYCVVYSYFNRIKEEREIHDIKEFCKKNNLKIICVGASQKWIKNYYPLNPFQLLKVFAGASFVITDTFHGTIFSVKYSKKFAVVLRPSNHKKLSDLVDRLGISRHLINSTDELQKAYDIVKDEKSLEALQKYARKKSIEYLKNNLI